MLRSIRRMTVGSIMAEPLVIHGIGKNAEEQRDRVVELLETVGLQGRSHAAATRTSSPAASASASASPGRSPSTPS